MNKTEKELKEIRKLLEEQNKSGIVTWDSVKSVAIYIFWLWIFITIMTSIGWWNIVFIPVLLLISHIYNQDTKAKNKADEKVEKQ